MDPFTQRILQRAEQRSKQLGITNKMPLCERHREELFLAKNLQNSPPPKKTPSPAKRTAKPSSYDNENERVKTTTTTPPRNRNVDMSPSAAKDNVDVTVEINITTGSNVQLQVEVEEQEIDEDGNILSRNEKQISEPTPIIRDSSRNRLQRLGALYSDSENLSSPIHKNEARFDENLQQTPRADAKNTKKINKLAALADTINNWEDDLTHLDRGGKHETISPTKNFTPKIVDSAMKMAAKAATTTTVLNPVVDVSKTTGNNKENTSHSKALQWDPNVMNALQMQGFERRESASSKLVYDFKKSNKNNYQQTEEFDCRERRSESATPAATTRHEKPKTGASSKTAEITKNLVSNRAALFENSQQKPSNVTKPQKDPAELSIKERLALFEQNKGTALMPKAALGMAPSAKQIMGIAPGASTHCGTSQFSSAAEKPQKVAAYNKPVLAESNAAGDGIRNTVAALMSNTTTISGTQITGETRKQREQEMNLLLNRYQKSSDTNKNELTKASSESMATPPPPPPPMPSNLLNTSSEQRHVDAKCMIKRKSNEQLPANENETDYSSDKRKKIDSPGQRLGRLYPVLSDIESTTYGSDGENCTTATVSENDLLATDHCQRQRRHQHSNASDSYYEDDDDSYMDEAAESSDGICDISLGREIMNAVRRHDPYHSESPVSHFQRQETVQDCTTTSEETSMNDIVEEMDEYLDEALDEDNDEIEQRPLGQKKSSISSNSFSYQKSPTRSLKHHQSIAEKDEEMSPKTVSFKSPIKSELTVNPSDDNNMVTLTHTVSFYRKQQSQSANNTPTVRRIVYGNDRELNENDEKTPSEDESSETAAEQLAVQEKVKRLFDEVDKQHQIMKQTSQALNLCAATFEFSGSTESVEGERHLLVATHRREAAKHEIERLQRQRCLRTPGAPRDRGRLTVKEITVPLRQDYKEKMDSSTICGHHLVCLLKYNETVLATKTVPTLPGLVAVKFPDTLQINNVYADFKVILEVYGMIAQKEVLPHDIKYHINKKGAGSRTPKGKKGQDSRLVMPLTESAGGPHVVRTPALSRYGVVELTLRDIQRTNWSMTQMTGINPLHGSVHMKINCELSVSIDYKGFLTMFEDVAGFGAWHRRWCRLHGHLLSFWRYPDDEKKKPPMGSVDLRTACTQKVAVAPRDVCARLNTFLVELKRPSQENDKESLVIVRQGKYTIVRYLLSADTKHEREAWCAYFNKALAVIRSWQSAQ